MGNPGFSVYPVVMRLVNSFVATLALPLLLSAQAFEVVSVRPNTSNAPASASFPLGPGDAYVSNGGLFSARNQPLIAYVRFAFKLGQGDLLNLPTWVYDDRFDIEARSQGSPTKDQVRLMMQLLLADRFKLVKHSERQEKPAFNLVLAKAGKTGPQLRTHTAESCTAPPSTSAPAVPSPPSSTSGLQLPPIACASIGQISASSRDKGRIGGRGVTMGRIAEFLTNPFIGIERPVFNDTGLAGTFDFSLEWALMPDAPDGSGPNIFEALQDQLGLKLQTTKKQVDVLVIDQIELPTPN